MMRRAAGLAVLAAAAVGVAGCGGSSPGAAAQSGSGSGSGSSSSSSKTPSTSGSTATAAVKHGAQTVPIKGFAFTPAKLVVKRGTKVTWVDRDAANHTVTFKQGPGDLGNLDQGQKRSARFSKRGTYRYVCQYHPNMKGTVVVK